MALGVLYRRTFLSVPTALSLASCLASTVLAKNTYGNFTYPLDNQLSINIGDTIVFQWQSDIARPSILVWGPTLDSPDYLVACKSLTCPESFAPGEARLLTNQRSNRGHGTSRLIQRLDSVVRRPGIRRRRSNAMGLPSARGARHIRITQYNWICEFHRRLDCNGSK